MYLRDFQNLFMLNNKLKHILFKILIAVLITTNCTVLTFAEIWHDDFDTENPDAWHSVGDNRVWKVDDGFLRVEVNRDWEVQYNLYQLIAFPAPYRDFSIMIKNFGGDKIRFGFCVGRHFPDTPEEDPFFYIFFPDEIRARRFNGKGSSHPFQYRLSREPHVRWHTDVLKEMELHFNSGDFLLFADGEFRSKFQDRNFNRIEILGFVVEGINIANEWVGEGWVDSFTISGLNVSPEIKVTSTWAQLKRR